MTFAKDSHSARRLFVWDIPAGETPLRTLKREGRLLDVLAGRQFTARNLSPLGNVLLVSRARLALLRQRHGRLLAHPRVRVLLCTPRSELRIPPRQVFDLLDEPPAPADLTLSLRRACDDLDRCLELDLAKKKIAMQEATIGSILAVGARLAQEQDMETLLGDILKEALELSRADAGSIALLGIDTELNKTPEAAGRLTYLLSINRSLKIDFVRNTVDLSNRSLAGFAVLSKRCLNIPDAYNLDAKAPYQFFKGFDQKYGFHTQSMLLVPMVSPQGETLGVITLINKKDKAGRRIDYGRFKREQVLPFDDDDVRQLESLGSQATVALSNALLNRDIENLFERFVQASVRAIEARDPTTSGHTFRVTDYTLRLAEAVNRARHPRMKIRLSAAELRELRYACLLHDFGKVAVRETVLLKAKKLEPDRLRLLDTRFELAKTRVLYDAEAEAQQILADTAMAEDEKSRRLSVLRLECRGKYDALETQRRLVHEANEPSVLTQERAHLLHGLKGTETRTATGEPLPLVEPEEIEALSVPRGSLTHGERREIESHVTHTWNFLQAIPWTRSLARVPVIAYGHHEKMDGTGYPEGLTGKNLLPQARMMAICDIFDALTASDRAYKKALPLADALRIIEDEVKKGKLDPVLYEIFLKYKVYESPKSA